MSTTTFSALICFIFAACISSATTLNDSLFLIKKKQTTIGNTNLTKNFNGHGEKSTFTSLAFRSSHIKYEFDITTAMSSADFSRTEKNITSIILNSYRDQPTPYKGVITNIATCPKKFTPIIQKLNISDMKISVVRALAGANFNHGICEENLIAFSVCTSFYYDEKKSYYFKLKVFAKPDEDCSKPILDFYKNLHDI